MDTRLLFADCAALATPLLIVFAVDLAPGKDADAMPVLLTTSDAVTSAAARWLPTGEFKAALGETLLLHAPGGLRAERLMLAGLGKAKTLSADTVRKGAGAAVRAAKAKALRELTVAFPEDRALSDEPLEDLPCALTARALVEGVELGEPDWNTLRSEHKDTAVRVLTVVAHDSEPTTRAEIEEGFAEGRITARAQNFARSLVNEPGNVLTPTELGRRAQAMCAEAGLACEVHGMAKLLELGMGAFAAVAQGSAQPPALIVMRYTPSGERAAGSPVIGLVGKGITFDTGGISIKPADGMERMKYDMAGGAAVIGAMQAIAALAPPVAVLGIVCSAENMASGKAYRPGDVVTAMSGKTIEIVNTDAEGRLVLADGLHYAKTLGATHLVDAATLTGACVVALGYGNSGLFSNDDAATGSFLRGLRTSGETFWRLPCTDDYRDGIKSGIADMVNSGGRAAGAVNAAMLLKEFAGDTPWLHLDIAGTALEQEGKPWLAKGPTGVALRSMVEWVRSFAG